MSKDEHQVDDAPGGAQASKEQQEKGAKEPKKSGAGEGKAKSAARQHKSSAETASGKSTAQTPPPGGDKSSPASSSPGQPSRSGVVLAVISLILVIATAAGGFAVWRQSNDQQQRLANEVEQTQRSIDGVEDNVAAMRESLDSLQADIDASEFNTQEKLAERVAAAQQSAGTAQERIGALQNTLGSVRSSVESLQSSVQSLGSRLGGVNDNLTSRLDSALSDIQGTQQSLQESVRQLQAQVNKRADAWIVAEAEYLIRVANQRLLLARDVPTAIRALENANQRLSDMGDPSLLEVRKKITEDILTLRSLPEPDITGMALTLEELTRQVGDLPLGGVDIEATQVSAAAGEQQSGEHVLPEGWRAFFGRMWSELKTLVVVRRSESGDHGPLVLPEQQYFLVENLRLKLEAARLALLRGEYQVFHATLGSVQDWLDQYFDTESAAVTGAQETLQELMDTTLEPQLPDLSGSLKALRQWNVEHGERSAAARMRQFSAVGHAASEGTV